MFPRKTLDLVILSILAENPDGLTGYALAKKIQNKFGKIMHFSTGTIYPRLDKFSSNDTDNSIEKQGNLYKITKFGKKKLKDNVPGVLDSNLQFIPSLYKVFMKSLPMRRRINYLDCSPNFNFFEDFSQWDEHIENHGFNDAFETLTILKNRLEIKRDKINDQIEKVNRKIRLMEDEQKNWTKIPIVDGDSED